MSDDWRTVTIEELRSMILMAEPDIVEEAKWRGMRTVYSKYLVLGDPQETCPQSTALVAHLSRTITSPSLTAS